MEDDSLYNEYGKDLYKLTEGSSSYIVDPERIASGSSVSSGSMSAGFLQSASYVEGVSGWMINSDGNVEFGSGYFRGDITGASGTFSGTITATLGSIGSWSINSTSIYTGTEGHSGYTANAGDITIYSDGSDASIHAKNFYIDTTGVFYTIGATIDGTSTIGGRIASTLATAIDASGHFADVAISTATQTIIGDFTFTATTGGLQIGTYVNGVSGDIRISSTGILGRDSAGATTFSINGTTGVAVLNGLVVGTNVGIGTAQTSAQVTTIVGNTVTTSFVNALNVNAATVSASISITTPTITGGTFQTSASANTGIKINTTALAGYNGTVQTVNIATDGSGWFGLTGTKAISWTTTGVTTIAGYTATATALYAGTTTTRIQLDTTTGIHLGATAFADAPFSVSLAGALVATSATVTGAINATSGKFGTATNYWNVGATGLTAVSASTDVIINYGKTDFTNVDTGFILGYDFSDLKGKFFIGNSTDYFNFNGVNTIFRTTLVDAITIDCGSNILLKEGGSIKLTSVVAPTACTATLVTTGTGNVTNGTHSYKIIYVTATGETSLGSVSNTVTVDGTHKQVDLSLIPISSSGGVTARRIYRTLAGDTDYYLLDTINGNSITVYTDNIADGSLGIGPANSKDNNTFGKIFVDSINSLSLGQNIFVGGYSGTHNSIGYNNTATGYSTLHTNVFGSNNTAIGYNALLLNTGGSNTAVGSYALSSNITCGFNSAFGTESLLNNIGYSNTAIGFDTLRSNTSGYLNTALGRDAGYTNQTGSNGVFIGYAAGKYETGSNTFYIDNQDRSTTAGDKAGALLYGVFNATPANQTLTVNAKLTALTYNGLTITAVATGFTIAGGTTSKTLTVPLDASVSGTNTGDQTLSSLGAAPSNATFVTTTAETGLSAEVNLGALSTGLLKGTVTGGVSTISAITDSSVDWNEAHGWGNHASAGYLTTVTAHNILSATHGDTTAGSCARGSVIVGDVNTKWVSLAFPATPTGKVLIATATDVAWSANALGTAAYTASTAYQASNATLDAVAGGTYSGDDSITTLGTVGTGSWHATTIALDHGGTGLTAVADGSILATNSANTLSAITWHDAGTKYLTNTSGTISWETITTFSGDYTQKKFGLFYGGATAYNRINFSSAYNSGNPFFMVMTPLADGVCKIKRFTYDANTKLPYITHSIDSAVTAESGSGAFVAVLGSYIYVTYYNSAAAFKLYRYAIADLSGETEMTLSGTAVTVQSDGHPIFTDGTYLYIYDQNGAHYHKYSVSGTTYTYEAATYAFGSANLATAKALSHWCDGTNVYCDKVTFALGIVGIVKYLLADGSTVSTTTKYNGLENLGWNQIADQTNYTISVPYLFGGFIYIDTTVLGLMRSGGYKTASINNYTYYAYLNPITKP